jgi:hypothetical protein
MIQDVIAPGDGVEHPGDVRGILTGSGYPFHGG